MARSLESLRQLQATKQVRSGNDFNAIEGFYYDCARFAGLGSAARGAAGAAWTVLYLKSKKKRRIPFPSEEEQRRRRNMLLMHPSQSEARDTAAMTFQGSRPCIGADSSDDDDRDGIGLADSLASAAAWMEMHGVLPQASSS